MGNIYSMTKINRLFQPCELCDGVTMMSAKGRILLDLEKEVFLDYFDYCPCCGRPLTADAVMETIERFGALDEKKEEYAV